MPDGGLWSLEDIDDFSYACRLVASASCCIGVQDELAQEMLDDVLKLLRRISGRSAIAVQYMTDPPSGMLH